MVVFVTWKRNDKHMEDSRFRFDLHEKSGEYGIRKNSSEVKSNGNHTFSATFLNLMVVQDKSGYSNNAYPHISIEGNTTAKDDLLF